jgi:hypothetical protein
MGVRQRGQLTSSASAPSRLSPAPVAGLFSATRLGKDAGLAGRLSRVRHASAETLSGRRAHPPRKGFVMTNELMLVGVTPVGRPLFSCAARMPKPAAYRGALLEGVSRWCGNFPRRRDGRARRWNGRMIGASLVASCRSFKVAVAGATARPNMARIPPSTIASYAGHDAVFGKTCSANLPEMDDPQTRR